MLLRYLVLLSCVLLSFARTKEENLELPEVHVFKYIDFIDAQNHIIRKDPEDDGIYTYKITVSEKDAECDDMMDERCNKTERIFSTRINSKNKT